MKEPLIKPGQQFKIDSIEELKEAYRNLKSQWWKQITLDNEIESLNENEYPYVVCDKEGDVYVYEKCENYETIPNPFKKSKVQRIKEILEDPECEKWEDDEEKPEPISTAMNNINEAIRSAKTLVEVAEMAKERNELREELKALREEVEKLKRERKIKFDFDESLFPKTETIRFKIPVDLLKEEKPKESEELKMKHPSCELTLKGMGVYAPLVLKTTTNECHFFTEKPEAIKIVNYLKKHFEI